MRIIAKSVGSYLPERIVSNKELEKTLDTNDAWITERTGITQRHVAAVGELTSHLGAKAAARALENGGFKPDDIDLVLVATSTPDYTLPSTATRIQHMLGMTRGQHLTSMPPAQVLFMRWRPPTVLSAAAMQNAHSSSPRKPIRGLLTGRIVLPLFYSGMGPLLLSWKRPAAMMVIAGCCFQKYIPTGSMGAYLIPRAASQPAKRVASSR